MNDDKPSWLSNTKTSTEIIPLKNTPADEVKRVKFAKKKTAIVKKKAVAKILKDCGLSIITADNNPALIVDELLDSDENAEGRLKAWADGRVISESGRRKRDAFVLEYIKDFNGPDACVRVGFRDGIRAFHSFKKCPYTLSTLARKMEKWEARALVTKDKVCALLWREANDFIYGTPSSRVAAANQLAKATGLSNDDININLGIQNNTYVTAPLKEEEFENMKRVFDSEY
jgi:hypothetical protein